jgi:hypothetical protein
MVLAADPGILMEGGNPYQLAKDYSALLETSLVHEYRVLHPRIPKLHPLPPVRISDDLQWVFTSKMDSEGFLHRWLLWERWDDRQLLRDLHSWYTFGDMAMARAPMNLHVTLIGSKRDGRQDSPWCRGYVLPHFPGRVRFQAVDGKPLRDSAWRKVWFSESSFDPAVWVDQIWKDGLAQTLSRKLPVRKPIDLACRDGERQISEVAQKMLYVQLSRPRYWDLPMSRGACDGMVPCPFLLACHRTAALQPAELCAAFSPLVQLDPVPVVVS